MRSVIYGLAVMLAFLMPISSHANKQRPQALTKEIVEDIKFDKRDITIQRNDGGDLKLSVEIATSPLQMRAGLMFREEMAEDTGMLFAYPEQQEKIAFWMKNTFIPLDIIFIGQDGVIHHIHDRAKPKDLTQIRPNAPAIAVLELNGGAAERFKIAVGDNILY